MKVRGDEAMNGSLRNDIIKNVIHSLLTGEDYPPEVIALIETEFQEFVSDFFRRIAHAKLEGMSLSLDWYREELPDIQFSERSVKIDSKTNNSAAKVALETPLEQYDVLYNLIELLTAQADVDVTFKMVWRNVGISFNVNECLIFINIIAAKRAALSVNFWSTAGKQVEKPLMKTLCTLLRVPKRYFDQSQLPSHLREVDFYLRDPSNEYHRCEVKLMGRGNPESADAPMARDSRVFVADTLSEKNKQELDARGILWVEMCDASVIEQFAEVLKKLGIPYKPFKGNLQRAINKTLDAVLEDDNPTSATTPFMVRESESEYLVDLSDELEETE